MTTSNFPVLATSTIDSLKTSANGGKVETAEGYDIVWTDSDGNTILNYEVEKYDATSGEIAHWVSVDVSASEDKTIYLYYGKEDDTNHATSTGVWGDNYQAVWHFSETSGAHYDSTKNNINSQTIVVTDQGSAVGQINGADSYNNSNNYIDFGDVLELDFPVTISAWVYRDVGGNADAIFSSNFTSVFSGYWLYVNSSGALEVSFGDGGGTGASNAFGRLSSNSSVPSGAWTYVVGTINGTTLGDINAYTNGQLNNFGSTGSATVYEKVNAGTARLGYRGGSSARMGGIIDEVRISNTISSAEWISTEYNNQVSVLSFLTIAAEEEGSVNTAPNASTLVSPANASYTADNTPTLSANYSDDDVDDTGTTNYRISSSSLVDCVNNINIVAFGSSLETSTNDEDTTYTPDSSIGSDGVYYWCAQNNDGVDTSSWTQMGSFTLDTTAPTNIGIDSISANSSSQITVTANTAVDAGIGIHSTPYWFDEISGASGATDSSSYQSSTTYVDTGLSPNTQYSYRVKAKDALNNESNYSSASSIYTLANIPTFLSLNGGNQEITASWNANSNPAGTEYYIENITVSTNSGWVSDTSWISNNLDCGTSYVFKVKARNNDSVETNYSGIASISTQSCSSSSGGGGGLPLGFLAPPAIPPGGWLVSVGDGSSSSEIASSDNRIVSLYFRVSSDINRLSISRYPDFHDAGIQAFQSPIDWDICSSETGLIKEDFCPQGEYTLYIKFYNVFGRSSETIEQRINLKSAVNDNSATYRLIKYPNDSKVYFLSNGIKQWIKDEATFNILGYRWSDIEVVLGSAVYPTGPDIHESKDKYNFTSYLSYGSIGQEVRNLQKLLKALGYFNYPSITGYYGNVTTQSVRDFQAFYGIETLGVVGPKTREKLNSF
ncbi:MAG: DUF2341 domain-containing protein [Patescibacteria group bacterium]|nr:DUF2341 domain-containing protein [Patescibacteria group bacterium]